MKEHIHWYLPQGPLWPVFRMTRYLHRGPMYEEPLMQGDFWRTWTQRQGLSQTYKNKLCGFFVCLLASNYWCILVTFCLTLVFIIICNQEGNCGVVEDAPTYFWLWLYQGGFRHLPKNPQQLLNRQFGLGQFAILNLAERYYYCFHFMYISNTLKWIYESS